MIEKDLSRSTLRNALSVLRGILNQGIEDELLDSNPAANFGKFTRAAKSSEAKGAALTTEEMEKSLMAAEDVRLRYNPQFLLALRAGLRRGELVAIQWGDIEFGKSDIYGHLIPGANVSYVDRLDKKPKQKQAGRQLSATPE